MFMFKAQQIYDELKRFAPDIASACRSAVDLGVRDGDFYRLDPAAFEKSPSDSIDYAVMEKTDQGVVVPLDAGWDDLGSWEAIWNLEKKDQNGNVIRGDVVFFDVSNSFVHAESRLVTLSGVKDLVVVETADAVMITGLKKTQGVKRIVDTLKNGNRPKPPAISSSARHGEPSRPWRRSRITGSGGLPSIPGPWCPAPALMSSRCNGFALPEQRRCGSARGPVLSGRERRWSWIPAGCFI
jgi:hypothetical protein